MENVIAFRAPRQEATKEKPIEPCKSPIVLERFRDDCLYIYFMKGYFTPRFLNNAIKMLAYGEEESWRIKEFEEDPTSPYIKYLIVPQKYYGERIDEILKAIVYKIVKEAYWAEIQSWTREVEVNDLTCPHKFLLQDGANISSATAKELMKKGIRNARDLRRLTREEICQIPGMTTSEVVKIEKSLASRGLYLVPSIPVKKLP